MNNKQRKKLKILKYTNEDNIKRIQWKNNILLQECLNNLETYQIISDDAIIRQIVKIASGIEIKRRFHSDIPMIEKNHDYYIVWDNERVPIIKCKGETPPASVLAQQMLMVVLIVIVSIRCQFC